MERGSVVDAQIELEEIEPKADHLGRYWWIDWFVYDEYYKIPIKNKRKGYFDDFPPYAYRRIYR